MRHQPRIYFSFRSPYSWMAVERLRRELPDPHTVCEFVPYWDPDDVTQQALADRGGSFHYVQMSKAKHLYLLHDTKRMAARLGLPMRWPIDIDPWWELPHLAFLVAREMGAEVEFYTEVTAARWQRGEDVCTPQVLATVARRCGLDPKPLLAAPYDPGARAAGVQCL
ncbi:MAG TPA: DsbA family protein, partial [Streptosporangiaceae bacterium]|nr:DsbA family protein [Streptosporangiaceae bacterium]